MKLIFFLLFIAIAYSDTDISSPVFRPPQWATASRPACLSPFGCLGYNTDTKSYDYFDGTTWKNIGTGGGGGTGDVVGPATVLDSSVALFDGTTGKLLKGIMCASGEILQSNGSAFVCATAGGGGIVVEDVLTSTSAVNALSANMGKVLNDRLLLAEASAHAHANKPLLDSLISTGTGAAFLADDGTYKVPPAGTSVIVEDALNSTSTTNALSANQGNVLDDKITLLQTDSHNHANKVLLDSLTDTGLATEFLSADGTYKVPAGAGSGTPTIVEDLLTSTSAVNALSANQGNVIDGRLVLLEADTHAHANKVLLDSLTDTGLATEFLSADGTYKVPAGAGSGTPTIVEDLLTSTSAVNALSANQGKILNDRLLLTEADTHNHANKPLLDTLTDTGLATEFLSADGTYKVPAGAGGGTPTIVEDLLTSTSAVNALSANQGKILNDRLLLTEADMHTHANKPLLDSLISTGTGAAFLSDDGTYKIPAGGAGAGDVVGPAISRLDTIAQFADATGKLLKQTPYTFPTVSCGIDEILKSDGVDFICAADAGEQTGMGDVVGPPTGADDGGVALFDGTTGKLLKNILCASGEVLQSNGTEFVCATAGGGGIIVEDLLTSTSAVNALSANQGKVLNDRLLLTEADTHNHANKPLLDSLISTGTGAAFLSDDGTYKVPAGGGGGSGDVVGPASSIDNGIAIYDGTTGKLIKDSGITLADIPFFAPMPASATTVVMGGTLPGSLDFSTYTIPTSVCPINEILKSDGVNYYCTYDAGVTYDPGFLREFEEEAVDPLAAPIMNRLALWSTAGPPATMKAAAYTVDPVLGTQGQVLMSNGVDAAIWATIIENSLTSTSILLALSANQGKILNDRLALVEGGSHTHINKALLDSLTDTGLPTEFLSADGTYKVPIDNDTITVVEDLLTSTSAVNALSANQGKVLDDKITLLEADTHSHANKPLLDSLISTGTGLAFLADDGTYKVPAGGGTPTIVEDLLTSTSAVNALSANQGKVLNDRLLLTEADTHNHANKILLDTLTDTGLATEFLSADGTYKVPAGGGTPTIVEDLLTSTSAVNALSANQGKVLNDRLLLTEVDSHSHANKPLLDSLISTGTGLAFLADDGTYKVPAGGGTGDVIGPASAIDSNIAVFDTATGKLIKDSGVFAGPIGVQIGAGASYFIEHSGGISSFNSDGFVLTGGNGQGIGFRIPLPITGYDITLPPVPPVANQIMQADAFGNLSWINTPTGGGAVPTCTGGQRLTGNGTTFSCVNNTYQVPAALAIDWATAHVFYKSISAAQTFTFSNQVNGQVIILSIENTSASDVVATLPASKWAGGTVANTIKATSTTIFTFTRINNVNYVTAVENMK